MLIKRCLTACSLYTRVVVRESNVADSVSVRYRSEPLWSRMTWSCASLEKQHPIFRSSVAQGAGWVNPVLVESTPVSLQGVDTQDKLGLDYGLSRSMPQVLGRSPYWVRFAQVAGLQM